MTRECLCRQSLRQSSFARCLNYWRERHESLCDGRWRLMREGSRMMTRSLEPSLRRFLTMICRSISWRNLKVLPASIGGPFNNIFCHFSRFSESIFPSFYMFSYIFKFSSTQPVFLHWNHTQSKAQRGSGGLYGILKKTNKRKKSERSRPKFSPQSQNNGSKSIMYTKKVWICLIYRLPAMFSVGNEMRKLIRPYVSYYTCLSMSESKDY